MNCTVCNKKIHWFSDYGSNTGIPICKDCYGLKKEEEKEKEKHNSAIEPNKSLNTPNALSEDVVNNSVANHITTKKVYGESVVERLDKVSGLIKISLTIFGILIGFVIGYAMDMGAQLRSGETEILFRIFATVISGVISYRISRYIALIFDWMNATLQNIQEQNR